MRLKKELKKKSKKCKVCKKVFLPLYNTTQMVCGVMCARAYTKAQNEKKQREKDKRRKLALMTRSEWLTKTQKIFNKWVRIRDEKEPCISCQKNKRHWQYHAGHYRSVGSAPEPELRFNENNVHKQCATCNQKLSGNLINYRINLIKKIGLKAVESLEAKHKTKHYTIDQIREIHAHYNALVLAHMRSKRERRNH